MTDRQAAPLTLPERDRLHHLIRRAARHLGAEERGALLRLWERQQAARQEPCPVLLPLSPGLHSPTVSPCVVTGPHEEHRSAEGMRVRPIRPLASSLSATTSSQIGSCPDPIECGHEAALGQAAEDIRYLLAYNGPRHAHLRPSVWDDTGKPCGHCKRLDQARQHLAALDGPAEPPACCVCDSREVVYRNYREQPFCSPCAEGCGQSCAEAHTYAGKCELRTTGGLSDGQRDAAWRETVRLGREAELATADELHARCANPGWEYASTEGPRKQWDDAGVPPEGDGWERNAAKGIDGWERFDYTEESYWRRPAPADGAS